MFERAHHRRIATLLEGLDADLLLKNRCFFGGGTAIALALGEYRQSVDIDFICSSVEGYRELRGLVSAGGIDTIFRTPMPRVREPRIDHYGIRCAFASDHQPPIKFEIVFEGRIALADPSPTDRLCGVWALAIEDKVATKLMANSDRWADDSTYSRDIIDLAMLTQTGELLPKGVAKAMNAYGGSVVRDLDKGRDAVLNRADRLKKCMLAMSVTLAEDDLRQRIRRLSIK